MISIESHGDLSKTFEFLASAIEPDIEHVLERYARLGVEYLSINTPIDTGKTASSWGYEIRRSGNKYYIYWVNDNIEDGVPIAILIQYGHATKNGGYVSGIDYINPSMQKVFEQFATEIWEEVSKL